MLTWPYKSRLHTGQKHCCIIMIIIMKLKQHTVNIKLYIKSRFNEVSFGVF